MHTFMVGNANERFRFGLFERGDLGPIIVGTELPIPTGAGIEPEVVWTYSDSKNRPNVWQVGIVGLISL